ncbi:hypothetical protein [Photobacterium sanguinicancri]|uniref:hypothetical protein n=1 Tax=Photobacterium sanguinicancri TaxID=875932 RepID=UPI0026E22F86|nr:hypothetical protein [Photobacterium sanguinicancri]MDO6499194.1 hypothetical protein [Photobacterium sanguinicancri]
MYKWIGIIVVLVGVSMLTSGVVSALLDLSAFLVLIYMVFNNSKNHHITNDKSSPSRFAFSIKSQDKDKFNITP